MKFIGCSLFFTLQLNLMGIFQLKNLSLEFLLYKLIRFKCASGTLTASLKSGIFTHELILEINFTPFWNTFSFQRILLLLGSQLRFHERRFMWAQFVSEPGGLLTVEIWNQRGWSNASDMVIICTVNTTPCTHTHSMTHSIFLKF